MAVSNVPMTEPTSSPPINNPWTTGGLTVVIGASGGLGAAWVRELGRRHGPQRVLGLSRHSQPPLDLTDEASIAAAAQSTAQWADNQGQPLRALLVATGFLHGPQGQPERSFTQLDPGYLSHVFAINTIGPALVLKHFLPLLVKQGPVLAALVSAKVGSIGDNALGGWYGYRASKAALNQIVKTASIELARRNRQATCLALHPGTVDTALSQPFAKTGLQVRPADVAASELLDVLESCGPEKNGVFLDWKGEAVVW